MADPTSALNSLIKALQKSRKAGPAVNELPSRNPDVFQGTTGRNVIPRRLGNVPNEVSYGTSRPGSNINSNWLNMYNDIRNLRQGGSIQPGGVLPGAGTPTPGASAESSLGDIRAALLGLDPSLANGIRGAASGPGRALIPSGGRALAPMPRSFPPPPGGGQSWGDIGRGAAMGGTLGASAGTLAGTTAGLIENMNKPSPESGPPPTQAPQSQPPEPPPVSPPVQSLDIKEASPKPSPSQLPPQPLPNPIQSPQAPQAAEPIPNRPPIRPPIPMPQPRPMPQPIQRSMPQRQPIQRPAPPPVQNQNQAIISRLLSGALKGPVDKYGRRFEPVYEPGLPLSYRS